MVRLRRIAALTALLAAAMPAAAGAAGPDDTTPCTGVALTDPAGDAVYSGDGSKEALDITAAWLRYDGSELKAYLRINQLKVTEPASSSGQRWALFFKLAGSEDGRFVSARYKAPDARGGIGALTFNFGHSHEEGAIHEEGATNGRVWEGTDGLIELVVPDVGPGEEGRRLESVYAMAFSGVGEVDVHGVPLSSVADRAPDEASTGVDATVASCPAPVVPAAQQEQAPAAPPPAAVTQASRSYTPFVHLMGASAVDFLQPLRLRGRVWPSEPGAPVEILSGDQVVARTATGEDGWFSVLVRPRASSAFRARSGDVVSEALDVAVRPLVTLDLHETTAGRLMASGTAMPEGSGLALVQRRRGARWVTLRRLRLTAGRFGGSVGSARAGRYRVVLRPVGGGAASFSEVVTWR